MQLRFDQTTDFQAIACKVVAHHRPKTFLFWRSAVHPEVGRDVRMRVTLRGHFVTEKQCANRIGDRLSSFLDEARAATRAYGCHDMDDHYAGQAGQPDLSLIHISEPTRQAEISYAV